MRAIHLSILLTLTAISWTQPQQVHAQNCPTIDMAWTSVSCNGFADGSAEALMTGGSGSFSFDWSNGASTSAISGLDPGVYYVNVLDLIENCSLFGLVEIEEPAPLSTAPTSTPVGCFGGNDGTASANVAGGTAPYTIIWSDGQIGPMAAGLSAMNYTVSVTDSNSCSTFGSVNVGTSSSFLVTFDSIQHVSCAGYSDGSVLANASGGSGIYQYLWNTGDTIASIDSLVSDYYTVTVADTNGCIAIDSILIAEPLPLSVTVLSQQATSCFNSCDGVSTVQASGGTAPYNYLWDANTGSQSGPIANQLCPDTFIVSVIDDNGCGVLTSAVILSPDTIIVNDSIINVSCYDLSDASIFTEVINSNGALQYQWSDTNYVLSQTSPVLSNVPAGAYFVSIVDSLGCQVLDTFHIDQPERLFTTLSSTDVSCKGWSDGTISQFISGGTAPYQILWSDGDTVQDRTGLTEGLYSLLITDTNSCQTTDSISVHGPELLSSEALINDVSCIQQHDGSIELFVTGGNGGYQYLWNNGDNSDELFGLSGGPYSVLINDMLGCTLSETFDVLVGNEDCINIPTAFTPNSDGLNDTWILRNIDLYAGNSVKVLNRWGQLVFESSGYSEAWNGRYNGNLLPAGTYYYVIDLNDGNEALTGPITLVK